MPRVPVSVLAGRTVLITGAASGIGAASASALAAVGARVVLVDLRQEPLDELAARLPTTAAGGSLAIAADVTDLEAMRSAVARSVEHFGALDVVFANAGIAASAPATISATTEEEFERIVEVDLLGVWRTVRAALPQIRAHRGHVLVTSSIYAFANGMVNAPYAMSKAGVESFGRSLRAEFAGTGATAGVLYPGWVETPIIAASHHDNPTTRRLIELAFPGPLRSTITPDVVASAVVAGIAERRARIIVPKRWAPISLGRGLVNAATDAVFDRHRGVQSLVRRLDRASNPSIQDMQDRAGR